MADDFQRQQRNADRNGGVGYVEGGPVIGPNIKFEEVHHISIREPVVKIAQSSTQNECQSDLQNTIPSWAANTVRDDNHCRHGSKDRQQQGLCGRADGREDSEGNSSVSHIRNIEKTVYYGCRFVQIETVLNPGLGPPIQDEGCDDQKKIWQSCLEL